MKKTMNRYLSMLLSVLMVLSSLTVGFVIFDTTADAAAAGTYYVKVTMTVSKSQSKGKYRNQDNSKWDDFRDDSAYCGFAIEYKGENGTDSTSSYYTDYDFNNAVSNCGKSGTITAEASGIGFPTAVQMYGSYTKNGTITVRITKIEVSPSDNQSNLTTLWSGSAKMYANYDGAAMRICQDGTYKTRKRDRFLGSWESWKTNDSEDKTCAQMESSNWSWDMPSVNSMTASSTKTVTVPNSVNTDTSTVYDQYGVSWYQAPYWSLHTSTSESQTAGNQTGYSNITFTSGEADKGTLSSSYKLFNTYTSSNSLTVYANPYLSGKTGASSAITINNAQFTVTLNQNGGTGGTSSQSVYNYRKGGNITILPTKEGYTFNGYYDAASNGTQYINSSGAWVKTWDKEAAGTLYAHWSPITYTVTLIDNGTTSTASYSSDSNYTFTSPTKTGYTFNNWKVVTAAGNWTDGETISSGTTTSGKYGNATLESQYTANNYTVKFDANGGTGTMSDETFTYDQSKALTSNKFTRTGYTFAGWATSSTGSKAYSDGQSVSNLTSQNGGTVTLYAVWSANTYKVSFNANGGTGTMSDETFTYDKSQALTANSFTRTGYTFAGWATSSTGSKAYSDGQSVSNLAASGSVTLYAVWTANKYTVKFDANGGTGTMSDETFIYNEAKALTANTFERKGYAFIGWNTDPDGNGKYYSDISKVSNLTSKNKDTVTLYAQWSAEEYTLTVSDNGTTTEKMYTIENSYTFAAPTKTGYTFNCWEVTAADDDGSWKVGDTYKGGATVTGKYGDATVTAKYTPNNYTVKFDANGGTGTMSDETFTYDEAKDLTTNTFTKTGYTFLGWSTDKSASSAQYQDKASVSNLTSQNGGTVTLYAVWSVNSYNVTFKYKDASGTDVAKTTAYKYGTEVKAPSVPEYSDNNYNYTFSSWSPAVSTVTGDVTYTAQYTKTPIKYTLTLVNGSSSETVEYSVSFEKTLGTPTKTGYTFAGWLVTTAGGNWSTGNTFSSSDTTSGKYGNATLTAQWTANTYTVKFNSNGGTGTMSDETFTYDKSQALTSNTFTKKGYTFAGWSTDKSATSAKYQNKASVSNLTTQNGGTVTLYAVWSANTYKVSFNANGGTGTMSDETFTYDQSKALTANAFTRTGYMFSGWNTSSDGNGTSYSDSASVKNLASADGSSATLYAQWKIINTTVYETTNTLTDSMVSSGDYNTVITLTDPTDAAEGKEFDKWEVTSGDGKVKFDTENKVWNFTFGTTDTHIKAVYSDIGYKVLISNASNGAQEDYYLESSDGTDKYTLGSTVTLPSQSVTGYRHTGWSVSGDGGKGTLIVDKDSNGNVTSATYKIGSSDAKITAEFTPINYTVAFNSNTGSGNMNVQSFTYDTAKALTANTFTKTGYTFAGWNTSSDGKGTSYDDGASVKNLSSTEGASVTLYAQWKANSYTVSFDSNGGSGTMSDETFTYDAAKALTSNAFTRTGYTFAGWNSTADGKGTSYADGVSVKNLAVTDGAEITLYAQWKANTYTVSFNANGGTGTMTDETFTYDIERNLPSNAFSRTGYKFAGWAKSADGAKAYDNGQSVKNLASSGTATLYAVWTANTYSVAFNPNGGAGYMANETFTYDVSKNLSSNAYVKTGYTFLGWSTDKSATSAQYQDKASVSNLTSQNGGTVTLYAVWSVNSYNVTFKYKDASGTDVAKTTAYKYGTEVKAPSVPEYSDNNYNYTFSSWSPAVSTVTGDVTYTAQYTKTPIKYTLTLVNGSSSKTVEYSVTSEKTLGAPVKTGYTFAGWLVTTAGGSWTTGETFSSADTTSGKYGNAALTAQWTANTYTVKFDANGGSGTMNDETFTYDKSQALTANEFTRTGYTFAGWAASSTGAKVYDNGQSVKNLASSGTATLYAVWTANTYTVKFDANGGSGTMNDETFTYDKSQALTSNEFTRTGYTFAGWSTDKSASSAQYQDKASVSNLTASGSVTLYAVWTANTYSVAFNPNGGTGTMADEKFKYGEEKELTQNAFTRTGYSFSGWAVTSTGDVVYKDKESVKNLAATGSITLYAVWSVHKYEVAFNYKTSAGADTSTVKTYNYGETITAPEVPSYADNYYRYNLSGWTPDLASTAVQDSTYTAKYSKYAIKYNITFSDADENSAEYSADSVYSLPTPVKAGYIFSGWKVTKAAGSWNDGEIVPAGTSTTGRYGDVGFTAQWTAKKLTARFVLTEGDVTGHFTSTTSDTMTVDFGSTIVLPTDVELTDRDDLHFKDWKVDGEEIISGSYTFSEDVNEVVFYAHYAGVIHTLTVKIDDDVTYSGATTIKGSNLDTVTLETPTKDGYDFNGWTLVSGSGRCTRSKFTFGNDDATITPNWKEYEYTLRIDLDGGKAEGYYTGYEFKGKPGKTVTLPVPTREEYKFAGWDVTSGYLNSDTNVYTFTQDKKTSYATAKWTYIGDSGVEGKNLILTVDLNGGSVNGKTGNITYYGAADDTVTLPTPARDGYKFTGWTTKSGTVSGSTYTFAESIQYQWVTANWQYVGSSSSSSSGSDSHEGEVCPYCGEVHDRNSIFDLFISFIHQILYLFRRLFGRG